MKYIVNSISLNMLPDPDNTVWVNFPVAKKDIPKDAISAIGHADMAAVVSAELGWDLPPNQETISLKVDDILYMAQYTGPCIPEGCKSIPEGAVIKWYAMKVCRREDME